MYKNSEGYNDPTAGAAFSRIAREERKKARKTKRKPRPVKHGKKEAK